MIVKNFSQLISDFKHCCGADEFWEEMLPWNGGEGLEVWQKNGVKIGNSPADWLPWDRGHLIVRSKSQHVGICAALHVISWLFRDIVSALTVVGHSLSLVRWRSTLCQMIYVTTATFRQSLKTHLFSAYQHVYLIRSVSRKVLYKSTLLTYLLTYLHLDLLARRERVVIARIEFVAFFTFLAYFLVI